MNYFQPMPIEQYVSTVIHEDREAQRIIDPWNIEKEEIAKIIAKHFIELGISMVRPLKHAEMMHQNVLFQLRNSPELHQRLAKIREEIERTKARHARHRS